MTRARASISADPTVTPGGEMARRIADFDWSATPLGPRAQWPQSLQTILRMMLDSRYAMWMGWGPELTFFCNDAYLPTVGVKRDWVLGAPARKVWEEIWPDIGPRIAHVMRQGVATWDEGLLLFLERSGFTEETYHTFSYSPVYDDDGRISGNLCVVTEETDRIIAERRMATVHALAAGLAAASTEAAALETIRAGLQSNRRDLPISLLYLLDEGTSDARLAVWSGVEPEHALAPRSLSGDGVWPTRSLTGQSPPLLIEQLPQTGEALPTGPWSVAPRRALLLPIAHPGHTAPAGVLIALLNPFRPLDEAYSRFLDLTAGQIASGLASVRAYDAERKRSQALAELDRAKTTFFSNISHEFRTPLTLMMAPLEETLRRSAELPAEIRRELKLAERNSRRLLKLVNTLLDFSRIEAGRVSAAFEAVDLSSFTADLASSFRSAIERAGLQLNVDCPPLPQAVYVDRSLWEKIILNLLSNAFKHTFAGEIHVGLRARNELAVLTVRDTGVGIPPDALPRLFERFFRVQGSRARTHEGSGIGLALVQELVRLHGGEIHANSAVDQGTTFEVALPFGCGHLPAENIVAAPKPPGVGREARTFVDEALRWLPDDAATAAATGPADLPRVILADDNADMREYLCRLLATDYRVEAVADGEAALAAARRERPALILSDMMMPRLDGYGVIAGIRGDPALRDVPIMILSARAGEEARTEGIAAGADDYVVKPFSARELLARVASQIGMSRQRNHLLNREQALRREAETLSRITLEFGGELNLQRLISKVTEAARELTLADVGAFYLAADGAAIEFNCPYASAGANVVATESALRHWEAALCAALFNPPRSLRLANTTSDARFPAPPVDNGAQSASVRSLLAVPVVSLTGGPLGALVFTHPQPDAFTERAARLASGIAAQAAIAIDNAYLFQRVEAELRERTLMEATLRHSEQRYRELVETLPAALYTCDAQGRILLFNEAAVALWGRQPDLETDRFTGAPRILRLDGTPLAVEQWPICLALREGRSIADEVLIERPDGTRRRLLVHPTPLRDAAGRIIGAANLLVDVTERRAAEGAAHQLAAIVESSEDAIISKTLDGIITSWNHGAERMLGYAAAEVIGEPITMLIPRAGHADEQKLLEQLRRGERIQHAESFRLAKDGRTVPVMMSVSAVRDASGHIIGAANVMHDITPRKRAEEAVRRQSARFQLLYEAASHLLTSDQVEGMVQGLFERIRDHLGVDAYFNFVISEKGDGLRLASCAGIPASAVTDITSLPFGAAICGRVALERRPIIATDIQNSDDPRVQLVRSFGIQSYACNPLLVGSSLVGTLSFASHTRTHFDPDEIDFMRTLCHYVAVAYHRVQLVAQLRDADRKKDEFLATLAHELRNPLAPIANGLHLLRDAALTRRDQANVHDIMQRQVNQMVRLVGDLLEVSRITRGRIDLRIEPVTLAEVVRSALDTSRLLIESARHDLTVELPSEPAYLLGDSLRLAQVFTNLLNNAAKYTDPGGRIRLSARVDGDQVVVAVQDSGQGIAPEMLSRVFEMFTQVGRDRQRAQSGLGIGLALARKLVELHNGTITAHSAGLGMGSEFIVRLPIAQVAQTGDDASAPAGEDKLPDDRMRVLVVDDNRDAAESVRLLLLGARCDARVAHDGHEALEIAEQFKPQALLLDIGLPGISGYEVARTLRDKAWARDSVFIALTGWGQDEDRRHARESGFHHHFTKPIDVDVLLQVLADGAPAAQRRPA